MLLYLALLITPWLYLRPFLRRKISASGGHLSGTFLFVAWLCASLLLHTPGIGHLGLDLDVSLGLFLVLTLCSVSALFLLLLTLFALQRVNLLPPLLPELPPGSQPRELATLMLLNGLSISLACSSYHGLCTHPSSREAQGVAMEFRRAVCVEMPRRLHLRPLFKRLMFEASGTWFPEVRPLIYDV